jgi:uncharacterized protein YycO
MNLDERAEGIYEYICDNTPDNGTTPWPHNSFSTLYDSAQEHYRHASRYFEREKSMEEIPRGLAIIPWSILYIFGLKFTGYE